MHGSTGWILSVSIGAGGRFWDEPEPSGGSFGLMIVAIADTIVLTISSMDAVAIVTAGISRKGTGMLP